MKPYQMSKRLMSLLLVSVTLLFFSGCKKQNSGPPNSQNTVNQSHGTGAMLDHGAFVKTAKLDIVQLRANLKAGGVTPKFQVYKNSSLQTDALSTNSIPTSVILNHPLIQDQGVYNTCVSFSAGYAAKSVLDLTWNNPKKDAGNRSPWFLYNMIYSNPAYTTHVSYYQCSVSNSPPNSGNGLYTNDGMIYVKKYGVASNSLAPGFAACSPAPSATEMSSAATDMPFDYASVTTSSIAKQAIASGLPVVFSFPHYLDLDNAFNTHTTWSTLNTPQGSLGHSMCLIGYDDTKNAFLAQNSWGTSGGDTIYPGCVWVAYSVADQLLGSGGGGEAYSLEPYYYNNTQYYVTVSPNTCAAGTAPKPGPVPYVVPMGKWASSVSVANANSLAQNDAVTNAQSFANSYLMGCVVPPVPAPTYTFHIVGAFSGTVTYGILINGQNISGTQSMGQSQNNPVAWVNPTVSPNATIVFQILSGTMPHSGVFSSANILGGAINIQGVISGNTITFSGIAMWGGISDQVVFQ